MGEDYTYNITTTRSRRFSDLPTALFPTTDLHFNFKASLCGSALAWRHSSALPCLDYRRIFIMFCSSKLYEY